VSSFCLDILRDDFTIFSNANHSVRNGDKILIFNQQSRPEASDLLEGLFIALHSQGTVKFNHVVFCTNVTYAQKGYKQGIST
jgi:hypothetical protein